MMARQMIGGQERQSGRTPWRVVSLCGARKALWGNAPMCLERGRDNNQNEITKPLW